MYTLLYSHLKVVYLSKLLERKLNPKEQKKQ